MVSGCHWRSALVVFVALALPAAATAQTAGALRVGASSDYTPFSFHVATGTLTGFDVAVAQRLAADLGRPIEFVPFRWPDLATQVEARAFDIAMSGVTVRPDRAVHMLFTRPYAVTGAVAVIRAPDRKKFRRLTDLDHPGVRVAVNRGGHLEQVARARFPHAELVPTTDNTALPELLLHGSADAAVSEELEARTWTAVSFTVLGPFTRDRKAYALPRDATDLVRQVNDWLAAREADGWLNRQRRQWFGARAVWTPQRAAIEALVAALHLRLQLMPMVAAVKRRDHLPIHDPTQEARVLERVGSAATSAGLEPDGVGALFRVQMEMARAVEQAAAAETAPADQTLADLRTAVAAVTDQIITELARCQPWLRDAAFRTQLDRSVRDELSGAGAGAPSAMVNELVEALHRVRRKP